LIELLVSMVIFGILIALITGLLIKTQNQVSGLKVRIDDVDQARLAVDATTRAIRTAIEPAQLQVSCGNCSGTVSQSTAFTYASATKAQFFTNNGSTTNGPTLVTIATTIINGVNVIMKTTQPPDASSVGMNWTYNACTIGSAGCLIQQLIIARGIPTGLTLFNYYDETPTELVPSAGASLGSFALNSIDSVAVNVTVANSNKFTAAKPTTIMARVQLPNARTGLISVSPSP
jgi:type II secretory pathway pseudopilin PulG